MVRHNRKYASRGKIRIQPDDYFLNLRTAVRMSQNTDIKLEINFRLKQANFVALKTSDRSSAVNHCRVALK